MKALQLLPESWVQKPSNLEWVALSPAKLPRDASAGRASANEAGGLALTTRGLWHSQGQPSLLTDPDGFWDPKAQVWLCKANVQKGVSADTQVQGEVILLIV